MFVCFFLLRNINIFLIGLQTQKLNWSDLLQITQLNKSLKLSEQEKKSCSFVFEKRRREYNVSLLFVSLCFKILYYCWNETNFLLCFFVLLRVIILLFWSLKFQKYINICRSFVLLIYLCVVYIYMYVCIYYYYFLWLLYVR